jgi:hypothetical protein
MPIQSMNIVDEIITNFSSYELREFKYFLQRRNNHIHERKDLQMIDRIRSGESAKDSSTNMLHQTRKRLKQQIELFVELENTRCDKVSKLLNIIEMATYLFRKNMYNRAWEYIQKAEQIAIEREEYQVLNFIYVMQMSYLSSTYASPAPSPSAKELLERRDLNVELSKMDMNAYAAYTSLTDQFKKMSSKDIHTNIDVVVNDTLKKYNLEDKVYTWPRIYSKIVNVVCKGLTEKDDYVQLKKYALKSYQIMQKKKMIEHVHADFMMELLQSICQASLCTRDYKTCNKFLTSYQERIETFKSRKDKYPYHHFTYFIISSQVFTCNDELDKAKKTLALPDKRYINNKQFIKIYFLYRINLLAVNFKQHNLIECIKIFSDLTRLNEEKISNEIEIGLEMILMTEIYGVIIYYENDDIDYAWYLLNKIKRKYNQQFKQDAKREQLFIKILGKIINDASYPKSKQFMSDYKQFSQLKEYVAGNKEYISLNAWLNARLTGRKYYDCFLDLV